MPSIIDQQPFNEHVGNGVTTVFGYEFELLNAGDFQAFIDGALIPPSNYVLAGVGVQAGGTVTFLAAPANGASVLLVRELELARNIDYQEQGDLLADTVNLDFNRLWQALQQQRTTLAGAIRAAFPISLNPLPGDPADYDGYYLGIAGGQPTYLLAPGGTAGALASQLADSANIANGDAMIAVKQPLTGSIARTQHAKNAEIVSVTDFGTITGVEANDTPIFNAAAAAANWVDVPANVVARVTPGGVAQYWKFYGKGIVVEDGQEWSLAPYPQTGAMGKFYVERTRGNRESAVALAVTANANVGQTRDNAQVLATDDIGALAVRGDYDHVAIFSSCYSYVPALLDNTSTYTATTVNNATIAALYAAKTLKVGDYILTRHATPLLGRVKSVSGTTATVVGGWYLSSTGLAATPANGTGAIVNPNNKVFGANFEVSATGNGTTTGAARCAGIEIGVTTASSGTPIPGTYGIDVVSRGSGYMDLGFRMRGKVNYAFFADQAGGSALYGFRADGAGRGLSVVDATVAPIEIQSGGGANTILGVAPSGALTISPLNTINGPLALNGNGQTMLYSGSSNAGYTGGASGLAAVLTIQKNTSTGRSGSVAGTWNVGGADYAEYERNNGLLIAKGAVVGFKVDGTLTLTFADAIRFGVKSTDPALVGGDVWGTEAAIGLTRPVEPVFVPQKYEGPEGPGPIPPWMVLTEEQRVDWLAREATAQNAIAAWEASIEVARKIFDTATMSAFLQEWATWNEALEFARQKVDRIAYSGKVPVNVLGATPGEYLVAVAAEDGSITAEPVPAESVTFAQYQRAIGRVNRILEDGRAEVAVIVH